MCVDADVGQEFSGKPRVCSSFSMSKIHNGINSFLNACTLSSQLETGATVTLGGVPATAIKSAMSLVAEGMKKA